MATQGQIMQGQTVKKQTVEVHSSGDPEESATSLVFGCGKATLDPQTGSITGFSNADSPRREYLIGADIPWHSPDF